MLDYNITLFIYRGEYSCNLDNQNDMKTYLHGLKAEFVTLIRYWALRRGIRYWAKQLPLNMHWSLPSSKLYYARSEKGSSGIVEQWYLISKYMQVCDLVLVQKLVTNFRSSFLLMFIYIYLPMDVFFLTFNNIFNVFAIKPMTLVVYKPIMYWKCSYIIVGDV